MRRQGALKRPDSSSNSSRASGIKGRKDFFFEKKKQKTFARLGRAYPDRARPKFAKVFWFFFSKKNRF
jgi:hypothetical protein